MITEHDLQEAIAECQGVREPNANVCIKLAAFYILKDHLFPDESAPERISYSFAAPNPIPSTVIDYEGDTEFAERINGMDADEFAKVMDELMSTLRVVNPRLYASVMRKLE